MKTNKIVITVDGTTTLARQYDGDKVVKSAEAKCNPDDTYDFNIGAMMAFARLLGSSDKPEEDKPIYKVGDKVKIIGKDHTPGHYFEIGTVGSITRMGSDRAYIRADHLEQIVSLLDIEPYCEKYREVKRPAKRGEYIKVINMSDAAYHDGRFKLGDILKVDDDDGTIINQWKGRAVGFKNISNPNAPYEHTVICNKDYVVLEGYQPKGKKQ